MAAVFAYRDLQEKHLFHVHTVIGLNKLILWKLIATHSLFWNFELAIVIVVFHDIYTAGYILTAEQIFVGLLVNCWDLTFLEIYICLHAYV